MVANHSQPPLPFTVWWLATSYSAVPGRVSRHLSTSHYYYYYCYYYYYYYYYILLLPGRVSRHLSTRRLGRLDPLLPLPLDGRQLRLGLG